MKCKRTFSVSRRNKEDLKVLSVGGIIALLLLISPVMFPSLNQQTWLNKPNYSTIIEAEMHIIPLKEIP